MEKTLLFFETVIIEIISNFFEIDYRSYLTIYITIEKSICMNKFCKKSKTNYKKQNSNFFYRNSNNTYK